MRKLLIIVFLFFSQLLSAATYYVATDGDDDNPGTINQPWATWGKAFRSPSPGDTVYFRGGVYEMDIKTGYGYRTLNDGVEGNLICFFAYPGETPILDCDDVIPSVGSGTLNNVIRGTWNYVHVKGLHIRNVWQNDGADECYAWELTATGTIIENCKTYNVHGVAWNVFAGYNLRFINCDAWNCCDSLTSVPVDNPVPGNDGAGFRVFHRVDNTGSIYFKNCRAWNCGDQGFSSGSYGYTEFNGCWSINNGMLEGGGWGFKLGWSNIPNDGLVKRKVVNCLAVYNRRSGFDSNDAAYPSQCLNIFNNTSYHNGYLGGATAYGFSVNNTADTDENELRRILKNNIAYANETGNMYVATNALYTHEYNSWDIPLTLTDADFISVDSTGITAPRQADGSLPDNDCYKYFLRPSSTFIGYQQGTDVGLTYDAVDSAYRTPPSIGFKEYYPITPAVEPKLADVATYKPRWITPTTASTGGYIGDDGGADITARGVCWNTTGTPTITDSKTSDGTGDGAFTSTMTGLTYGTVYYVRAYGTNSAGTSYGSEMTFRTSIIQHDNKVIKHNGKIMVID
jgi:hypothetical protein